MIHIPVLLQETIEALNLEKGKCIVDGTLNGGGHAREIIKRIMPAGTFIGVDLDKVILEKTERELLDEFPRYKNNLFFEHANYKDIADLIARRNYPKPQGIVLDLGFSSFHIQESGRGFSFQKDEILDMRYDQSSGNPVYEIVNSFDERALAGIFWKYGEERFSRQIAKAVTQARRSQKISTTRQLSEIVKSAIPGFYRKTKIDPATKTFQALRIFVNNELENLDAFLTTIPLVMGKGGRLAIISFHSLEDRMVKNSFNEMKKKKLAQVITKKPVVADKKEILGNPKSRSAKLRVLEIL